MEFFMSNMERNRNHLERNWGYLKKMVNIRKKNDDTEKNDQYRKRTIHIRIFWRCQNTEIPCSTRVCESQRFWYRSIKFHSGRYKIVVKGEISFFFTELTVLDFAKAEALSDSIDFFAEWFKPKAMLLWQKLTWVILLWIIFIFPIYRVCHP